jgi:hypothetical protein
MELGISKSVEILGTLPLRLAHLAVEGFDGQRSEPPSAPPTTPRTFRPQVLGLSPSSLDRPEAVRPYTDEFSS